MKRRAIFLDRDGTLNREQGFVTGPEHLVVLPGVVEALDALAACGYALVVLTNQSGIARGLYDERDLARVHDQLQEELGGRLDAFFHCPHHPDAHGHPYGGECVCRKPKSGLLAQAVEVLGLDLRDSWLVGDSARDLLLGRGLPLSGVLLRCGKPWEAELAQLRAADLLPKEIVDDLPAAASYITSQVVTAAG